MALTPQQIAAEKAKEAQYNEAANQVLQVFIPAYAKLHGYFRAAAAAGQGAIPHRICTDADGREITVYNSTAGKIVGSYLTPTHEYITHALSQNKIGQAIASIFGGQSQNIKEQKAAVCVTVTPNDVLAKFPSPLVPPASISDQINTVIRESQNNPANTTTNRLKTFIAQAPTPVLIISTFAISTIVIFGVASLFKN